MSANVAYGEVKLEALGDVGGEYEGPDKLARSGRAGGGNYEPTGCPALYESTISKPEAPVYMLQQMIPLTVEKQHNDCLKLMLTRNYAA